MYVFYMPNEFFRHLNFYLCGWMQLVRNIYKTREEKIARIIYLDFTSAIQLLRMVLLGMVAANSGPRLRYLPLTGEAGGVYSRLEPSGLSVA